MRLSTSAPVASSLVGAELEELAGENPSEDISTAIQAAAVLAMALPEDSHVNVIVHVTAFVDSKGRTRKRFTVAVDEAELSAEEVAPPAAKRRRP